MSFPERKRGVVAVLSLGLLCWGVAHFFPGRPGGPSEAQASEPPSPGKPEKSKPGSGAEADELPPDREQIQKALKSIVKYPGVIDIRTTLGEVLEDLRKAHGIPFHINDGEFLRDGIMQVLRAEVANPDPIPAMHTRLETVLRKILSRIPAPSGVTYLVRKDHVEITTSWAVRRELGLDPEPASSPEDDPFGPAEITTHPPLLPPLVVQRFEGPPLPEALDAIAESADVNVLLDPRVEGVGEVKVRAKLYNVPAETAVRVLAEMAGLGMARVDNVLYVTTPENAERIRKEQERLRASDRQESNKPPGAEK